MLAFGSLFLAIILVCQAISIRKEHSLAPPYQDDNKILDNWDLTGSAVLDGDYIRLTPDEADKQGAVWNNFPCFSNNWEFQVLFHIHGKGIHLNGDGIALWYVKESDMLHSGPVFGSKDYFTGLGVFIDTFANQDDPHKHRHPYISAMVNNGSLHYEHDEDGTMTQIGGCHAAVRNLEIPTRVAVSYINNILSLYVDNEGMGQWKICFKSEGVHLPTAYNFGISASTSDVSDNHDILAVTSLNLDPDDLEWEDRSDIIPEAENIQIPEKYHKEYIEEELQKVEKKREIKEEVRAEEERAERGEHKKEKIEHKKEKKEHEKEKKEHEETVEIVDEEASPSTSLLRKLIYLTGAIALILISISTFKKYSERRRVRIEKRLY